MHRSLSTWPAVDKCKLGRGDLTPLRLLRLGKPRFGLGKRRLGLGESHLDRGLLVDHEQQLALFDVPEPFLKEDFFEKSLHPRGRYGHRIDSAGGRVPANDERYVERRGGGDTVTVCFLVRSRSGV